MSVVLNSIVCLVDYQFLHVGITSWKEVCENITYIT